MTEHDRSLEDPDEVPEATALGERGLSCTSKPYSLVVTKGPDAGKRFDVDVNAPSPVLVGTGPACGVRLTDPKVSRRHGSVEPTPLGLRLADLGSTNGTRVAGLRVEALYLSGGELVVMGETELRIETGPHALALESHEAQFGRVIGVSPEMRRLYAVAARIAAASVPVLIEGETGTGKESLAEAIHETSPRAKSPFVVVDCTAIAPTLIEAELFGHERGAFTGAVASRAGLFEEADGGTLFIDEIGDLDLPLQAKLLRAIERGEIRRLGDSRWTKVDVRIVSATRRNLDVEVQAGRFRDDLFYRLAVTRLEMPPLRKRQGDIPVLVRHFWRELGGHVNELTPELLARFEAYDWPGNVRELQNAVAKRLTLGEDASVGGSARVPVDDEGDVIADIVRRRLPFSTARQKVLTAFERRYVAFVLAEHGGNIGEAAKASGVARRYFQMIRTRTR